MHLSKKKDMRLSKKVHMSLRGRIGIQEEGCAPEKKVMRLRTKSYVHVYVVLVVTDMIRSVACMSKFKNATTTIHVSTDSASTVLYKAFYVYE